MDVTERPFAPSSEDRVRFEEGMDLVSKLHPKWVRDIVEDIAGPMILKSRVITELENSIQKHLSNSFKNSIVSWILINILPAGLGDKVGLNQKLATLVLNVVT
jgi:hypothetical protein